MGLHVEILRKYLGSSFHRRFRGDCTAITWCLALRAFDMTELEGCYIHTETGRANGYLLLRGYLCQNFLLAS